MLLFIGPRYLRKNRTQVGGIIIQFEDFLEWLEESGIPVFAIDSNKKNYRNKLTALLGIWAGIITHLAKADRIVLHATYNDCLAIAPLVVILAKLTGKKMVLRKFAGSFDQDYQRSGPFKQMILRLVMKYSDLLFFETRYLVNFGRKFNPNVYQFSNARKPYLQETPGKIYQRKLLFLSQIMKEKGIEQFIQLKQQLSSGFAFTAVGPLVDKKYNENYFRSEGIVYKGAVLPEHVHEVLHEHDFLVLPTFWSGEGYPGVVIEAFGAGTPVIATTLRGISEIIESGRNGFLFNHDDLKPVVDFISNMDQETYTVMSQAAYSSSKAYNNQHVYQKVVEITLK